MGDFTINDVRQTRREFCVLALQSGSIAALGGLLAGILEACNPGGSNPGDVPALPTINATAANGTITIPTASGSPIAGVGTAALVNFSGGSLLVAHPAANTFSALTAVCTHQGCIITGFSGGTYTCPCHGSQFSTSGQVTKGPASSPLRSFAVQAAGSQLVITL
jgi:Rieske Fe-S protein